MMTDEQKLERCAVMAARVKALNPAMVFAYNTSAVVLVTDNWKLTLLYSWAITGKFVDCTDCPVDVTGYTERDKLKFAELAAEPVTAGGR